MPRPKKASRDERSRVDLFGPFELITRRIKERPPHETAMIMARAMDASMAIDAGQCPNGCGEFHADACGTCGRRHPECHACGFALHVYAAPVVDLRPIFNRRPVRARRYDRPS